MLVNEVREKLITWPLIGRGRKYWPLIGQKMRHGAELSAAASDNPRGLKSVDDHKN